MDANIYRGLSNNEVAERLRIYGYNRVPEHKESEFVVFFKKFIGLTPITIEVVALISYIFGRYIDFAISLSLLLVNATIGFIHETRANRAVDMLRSRLRIVVKTLRNNEWIDVDSEEIVPDDVIKLTMGDVVPADGVILDGSILVDESALTGESIPVEKSSGEFVYAGTVVIRGEAIVKVTATGSRTKYGKTVALVERSKPRLILEEITSSIMKWLLVIDLVLIALVLVKLILTKTDLIEIVPFTLTLLLASIPVALPAMTTITLAIGSMELARKGIIIRRLEAIESASMMDIICLDKTGTITENKLVVEKIIPLSNRFSERDVLTIARLASEEISKDPLNNAIIEKARELNIDLSEYKVIEFKPFTPETKMSEAVVIHNGKRYRVVKGAPQVLLDKSINVDDNTRKRVEEIVRYLGENGLKPIAIGIGSNSDLEIIGILGLHDKIRSDSVESISVIKNLGVEPKIISGDNLYVASAVASKVGVPGNAVSLRKISRKELENLVEETGVFAEALPEDKYFIVEVLQKKGHVVGMTGDGVNDAPALKKADLGIAVHGATDVAKSAASVVLTQPGLKTIANIIELGRVIYRRIVVWTINKIVKTFSIVYFVSLTTILLGLPILTPTHMILMIFLYDLITLSISIDKLKPSNKPEKWNIKKLVILSSIIGLLKLAELYVALFIAILMKLSYSEIQSFIFYILVLSGLLNFLNFRETSYFWRSMPNKNIILIISIDGLIATAIVLFGIGVASININSLIIALIYTVLVTLLLTDIVKVRAYRLLSGV